MSVKQNYKMILLLELRTVEALLRGSKYIEGFSVIDFRNQLTELINYLQDDYDFNLVKKELKKK